MSDFYHYLENEAHVRANVLTYNNDTNGFNNQLDNAHTKIDTRHDQEDATRSSTMIRTNQTYANNLRTAMMMSYPNLNGVKINQVDYDFKDNSIHRLADALKREDGSTTFDFGSTSMIMPKYKILAGNSLYKLVATGNDNIFTGMQLEVKPFKPAPGGRDRLLGEIRQLYGQGANSFVNDCGSSAAYTAATPDQLGGGVSRGETSVLSGVGDSSSTTAMLKVAEFQDWHQTFIPFMRHGGGVVYVYATPYHDNQIFLWFSLLQADAASQAIQGQILGRTRAENLVFFSNDAVDGTIRATRGAQPYLGVATDWKDRQKNASGGAWTIIGKDPNPDPTMKQDQDVPNLPDVSNYIASQWWNQTWAACIDIFIKRDATVVQQKCQVFFDIALIIFGITLPVKKPSSQYDKVVCFFMYIKHFGDRWRGIDSLLLSESANRGAAADWRTLTGTFDSFLIRWILLGGMYGLYINKGTNLILSDIRAAPTDEQQYNAKLEMYKIIYTNYTTMYDFYSTIGQPSIIGKPLPPPLPVTMQTSIFSIAEWFAVFFQKARLHQPRGARFRKIVSLVAPKSFSTEMFKPARIPIGTYVYREEEMAILWTCFQMLWILMDTLGQLPPVDTVDITGQLPDPNTLETVTTPTPQQERILKAIYDVVTKTEKGKIDDLRKYFLAYMDSERVLGLFYQSTSPYTNANMLQFASRVVKVMKINVSEYAPGRDIVPWGLDTGINDANTFVQQQTQQFTFTGGGSNQVIKQTGGDNYHKKINDIEDLLKNKIREVITRRRGPQIIGFTYSYDISQGTGYAPRLYIFCDTDTTGQPFDYVPLPLFNELYNDIQKYYCDTKQGYQMFEPETFEDLRTQLYDATKTTTTITDAMAMGAINAQTSTRQPLEDYADDGFHDNDADDGTGADLVDQAVETANRVITDDVNAQQSEYDNNIDLIDILSNTIVLDIIDEIEADNTIITDAINEAPDMDLRWKQGHIHLSHTMTNNVHTGSVVIPQLPRAYRGGGKVVSTAQSGDIEDDKPSNVENEANQKSKADKKPEWKVLFNKKAYGDAMSKFTTLCRKNADKIEDCYGDEPFTNENYIEYLESKIALDKYYLSLYDNKALEPTYVNCTEEEFSKFFDNEEKEVDAETDKRMLKNTIKDYQESIAQIKKDLKRDKLKTFKGTKFIGPDGKPLTDNRKHIPEKMNAGPDVPPAFTHDDKRQLLTGYGGKRRTKTMKSRKPSTNKSLKKRYATKTSHRKKTKNANRSKNNNTRKKRHY